MEYSLCFTQNTRREQWVVTEQHCASRCTWYRNGWFNPRENSATMLGSARREDCLLPIAYRGNARVGFNISIVLSKGERWNYPSPRHGGVQGRGGILPLIPNLTLEESTWLTWRSGSFIPRTHCIADWVGLRTGYKTALFVSIFRVDFPVSEFLCRSFGTQCSETSTHKIQTPGVILKKEYNIQNTRQFGIKNKRLSPLGIWTPNRPVRSVAFANIFTYS
jgi:hypothetical protein